MKLYSARDGYNFKEPTNRSHPIFEIRHLFWSMSTVWDRMMRLVYVWSSWLIQICEIRHLSWSMSTVWDRMIWLMYVWSSWLIQICEIRRLFGRVFTVWHRMIWHMYVWSSWLIQICEIRRLFWRVFTVWHRMISMMEIFGKIPNKEANTFEKRHRWATDIVKKRRAHSKRDIDEPLTLLKRDGHIRKET